MKISAAPPLYGEVFESCKTTDGMMANNHICIYTFTFTFIWANFANNHICTFTYGTMANYDALYSYYNYHYY